MSAWRNMALSVEIEACNRGPSRRRRPVTIRGLISASEASLSITNWTNRLRKIAPFFAVSPVNPRAPRRPFGPGNRGVRRPTSIGSLWIFSGWSWATVSISTPPSVEAIKTGHWRAAIDGEAEIKLLDDVVADRHEDLVDRRALDPRLIGDERLVEQALGGFSRRLPSIGRAGRPWRRHRGAASCRWRSPGPRARSSSGPIATPLPRPPAWTCRLDHDQGRRRAARTPPRPRRAWWRRRRRGRRPRRP